jgi:catechol 2,3-dioxygenase-like lactoylglutathione lyase family enzyme
MITGIGNIGLGAANLAQSVAFYQRLGFTKAFENDRGITMIAGSAKLFLFPANSSRGSVSRSLTDIHSNPRLHRRQRGGEKQPRRDGQAGCVRKEARKLGIKN